MDSLNDDTFAEVKSFHSDSALSFGLFMNQVKDRMAPCTPDELRQLLLNTIAIIIKYADEAGVQEPSLLNFVVSDGVSLVASRFVSHGGKPASLYYAVGAGFECVNAAEREYHIQGSAGSRPIMAMVASEPITSSCMDWVPVPANHTVVFTPGKGGTVDVAVSPIPTHSLHPPEQLERRQLEVSRALENLMSGRCLPSISADGTATGEESGAAIAAAGATGEAGGPVQEDGEGAGEKSERGGAEEEGELLKVSHRLSGDKAGNPILASSEQYLFASCNDGRIGVWDVESLECIRTLEGHTSNVMHLLVYRGHLWSAGGCVVKVWSLTDFECLQTLDWSGRLGVITSMVAGCSDWVFTGWQDNKVRALRVEHGASPAGTPEPAAEQEGASRSQQWSQTVFPKSASACSLASEEDDVSGGAGACGGSPATPAPGGADGGACMGTVRELGHCSAVYCMAQDDELLCTGGGDGTVKVR